MERGREPELIKTLKAAVAKRKRPLIVFAVCVLAAAPTAGALRLQSHPAALEAAGGPSRATPGTQAHAGKPWAKTAVRGHLPRAATRTRPTQLYLRKAHSAIFDARTLKGTVVKRERPERPGPGETAGEDETAVATLPSSVTQKTVTAAANAPAPSPDSNFPGLDFANWGAGHPPDTNGDVGPTYYIQTINTSIGIYDKSNGNRVAAFTFDAFMSQGQFGNLCDTDNFGDPVVVYDSFEDRWIITDFAFKLDAAGNVNPQTVYQCFAASKTGDPVNGGWNYYSILAPGGLADYPKFGVWPDGLYMSANMFGYSASSTYTSYHVWAIDKAQMYAGAPTVQVADFAGDTNDFTVIPANARLQAGTPPGGSPEYFTSTEQWLNALSVYKLHVDWDKISTSTFTGPFTQLAPTCWPNATPANASTTANAADVLAIRAMAQTQYSNIGGAESLWVSHTVQRGESVDNTTCNATTGGNATIRWYQANVTGGTIAANVTQGKSYDPDRANTFFRFMPSLAVDRVGDMAIGYTKSNSTTNPQMKYAGRLAGDPVNTLGQDEQTLINGTGSQSGNCGSSACTRWGDYSGMALDPNGCEFWETGEYYSTTGLNHQTRIGSFHFPSCTTVGSGTVSGAVTDGTNPVSGATVTLGSRTTTTNGSGNYSFSVAAGTYPAISASKDGFDPSAASAVTVPNGGGATRNFTLSAAAQSGCFTDNTQSAFQRGAPANCDLVASPGNVVLASPDNTNAKNDDVSPSGFGISNTSWGGQTFTPTVTGQLKRVDVELFCASCTIASPNITLSVRNTTGATPVPTSADLGSATLAGFNDDGAGGLKTFTFATPVTVTAGTRYAFVFRLNAAFAGGTMAYTCSCVTTGFSNTNPYANGQRVTSTTSGATWAADTTAGGRDLDFVTYINPGFATSGTFVSSVKDANPQAGRTANWTTLTYSATTPAGTGVKFQVAGSNSANGPFNFVGPDGTASTFFTTSGADLSRFDGLRYLRYKAYLSTTSTSVTPALQSVSVCFQDTSGASASSLAVGPATGTYGGTTTLSATLTSSAKGLSGKSVSFTLNGSSAGSAVTNGSGVATLAGVSLSVIGAGSYPTGVAASFAGDSSYAPSSGSNSLTVAKADQGISIATHAPATAVFGTSFGVAASGGGSGNAVTLSGSGACSNSGATFTMTSGTGTCTVKYDQAGNANYNAAPQLTESATAQKANQTITVTTHAPTDADYNSSFDVGATAASGLSVGFSSSGACTNTAAHFTITSGSGACTAKYDQAGNGNYNAAVQVTESVTAHKASQAIAVTTHAPASAAYGLSFGVAANGGGSGNAIAFSSSGVCSNTANTFTMTSGTGTCSVKYDQAGDANYNAAPEATETVTAQKAQQTITVTTHAPTSLAPNSSFDVAATAGSGLPVSFSSAGTCSNAGQTFTTTGSTGTCTVKYDQTGDGNYNSALQVAESVSVGKASQTITVTIDAPASAVYGTSFDVDAAADSGLPVSFSSSGSCSNAGAHFTMTSGTGTCTVKFDQSGNDNYGAASQVSEPVGGLKAALTVSPSPSTATRQYSDPNPPTAAVVTGFVNGDDQNDLTAQPGCGSSATAASAPGSYAIACSGGDAANYTFTYLGGTLTVGQEDARTAYTGNTSFQTASASTATASVRLSASVRDISAVSGDPAFDSFPGDIRNATVTFVNRATGTALAGCANLPVTLTVPTDSTVGTTSCTTSLTAPKKGQATYTVGIVVGGFYARNASADDRVITVARPSAKKPPVTLVLMCYRHHTVRATKTKARTLRRHGAKSGACKRR